MLSLKQQLIVLLMLSLRQLMKLKLNLMV